MTTYIRETDVVCPRTIEIDASVDGEVLISVPCQHGHNGLHTVGVDRAALLRAIEKEMAPVDLLERELARVDWDAELKMMTQ